MPTHSIGLTIIGGLCLAVAACSPLAAASPAPEPRETVVRALRSTADLHAVHARLRLEFRDAKGPSYLWTIEGDVDVAARELDVAGRFVPTIFGTDEMRLVITDGTVFTRQNGGAWSSFGGPDRDPLVGVPTTAQVARAIEGAIRDPATTVVREGTEPCDEAICHRIRAEIPAAVAWKAFTEMLKAPDHPAEIGSMPASFPGVAIDLWIQQDTLRLRQATNSTKVDGATISITLVLSGHDSPVTIEAPIKP